MQAAIMSIVRDEGMLFYAGLYYVQFIILGIIQGFTEFLPVSSSAHLVIAEFFMNMREAGKNVMFDVFLHVATLLAVIWVYRKDLRQILTGREVGEGANPIPKWRLIGFLALSIIATGVSIPFKGFLEAQFASLYGVRIFLLINAAALAVLPSLRKRGNKGLGEMTWLGAVIVGLVQAVAVLPGISRSGSTIIACLLLGLSPKEACRYSFLLAIPTIFIAALTQVPEAMKPGLELGGGVAVVSFLAAVACGILAIPLLVGIVERGKLWGFAIYCAIVGIVLFIVVP
jgi:undecaprenyl-diphosphatase